MGKKLLEFNWQVPIDAENIHTSGRHITHAIEASWQARLWARMHAPPYFCRETPVKHRALTASESQPAAPSSASWPLHLHLQQQSTPVAANTSLAHDLGASAGTKMPSCTGRARSQNCSSSGRPELEEKPGRRVWLIVRKLGMPFGNCLAYGQGCSLPIPSKVFGHGQPESSAIFIQVKLVSARTCTGSGAALRASRGMSQQQLPQISNPGVKDDETNSCIASQPGEIFRVRTCAGNLLIR